MKGRLNLVMVRKTWRSALVTSKQLETCTMPVIRSLAMAQRNLLDMSARRMFEVCREPMPSTRRRELQDLYSAITMTGFLIAARRRAGERFSVLGKSPRAVRRIPMLLPGSRRDILVSTGSALRTSRTCSQLCRSSNGHVSSRPASFGHCELGRDWHRYVLSGRESEPLRPNPGPPLLREKQHSAAGS